MTTGAWKNVAFLAALLALFIGFQLWRGRAAPVPGAFEQDLSLAAAIERSQATGKPIFALFTADWCGACQTYKRGALDEPEVAGALAQRTIPVYVDVDKQTEDVVLLARLGLPVEALPTSVVLRAGEIETHAVGAQSPAAVLAMIDRVSSE